MGKKLCHWVTRLRDIATISVTRDSNVQRPKRLGNKLIARNAISLLYQNETIISDAQTVAEGFQKQGILSRTGSDTKKQKKVSPASFVVSYLYHHIT